MGANSSILSSGWSQFDDSAANQMLARVADLRALPAAQAVELAESFRAQGWSLVENQATAESTLKSASTSSSPGHALLVVLPALVWVRVMMFPLFDLSCWN